MTHVSSSLAAVAVVLGVVAVAAGCSKGHKGKHHGDAATTASSTAASTGSGGAGGESSSSSTGAGGTGGSYDTPVVTAKGTLTLKEVGNGLNCSSTFTIDAVEDASSPWQCPTCAPLLRSALTLASSTCTTTLNQAPTVAIGFATDGGVYFARGTAPAQRLGTVVLDAVAMTATVTIDGSYPDGFGGEVTATGSGSFALGQTMDDVLHGFRPRRDYTCSWPHTAPPAYTGDYRPLVGDAMPDGVFLDRCAENIRLQDFEGRYLVLQANQTDTVTCGSCMQAAQDQKAFEDAVAGLGVPAFVVQMLVPSGSAPETVSTLDELQTWVMTYGAGWTGVTLADRGFLPALFGSIAPGQRLTYPSFILVAPDGAILYATMGYTQTAPSTWDDLKARIQADAGL